MKLREFNRLTLNINISKLTDPAFASVFVSTKIVEVAVDKSITVREFRDILIDKLNIPRNALFRIVLSHNMGDDLIDSDKKISECQLFNNCHIHLLPGHVLIKLFYFSTLLKKDTTDSPELGKFIIHKKKYS